MYLYSKQLWVKLYIFVISRLQSSFQHLDLDAKHYEDLQARIMHLSQSFTALREGKLSLIQLSPIPCQIFIVSPGRLTDRNNQ